MKILFCDNSLYSLINFRGDVINSYADDGHDVVLVAPDDSDWRPEKQNVKYIPVVLHRSKKNPFTDIKYLCSLYKIYKTENPDYVFHYTIKPNIYGTFVAKFLRIPSVLMVTGLGYTFNSKEFASIIARTLYRCAMRASKFVIVLNKSNKDILMAKHMTDSRKMIMLPGGEGINLSLFNYFPDRKSRTHFVFLMVARVLYDKGYKEYVEASRIIKKKYPDMEFMLLGSIDEDYPNHVPSEIVRHDATKGIINYLGFRSDVREIIGHSDCIVLPSYHEGLSRVLMEGLAMHKPIITTDIPGCRETVDDGKNGYLIPPKNIEALVEAIEKFIHLSDDERKEMGEYARKKAEREFDVRNVIAVYKKITDRIK